MALSSDNEYLWQLRFLRQQANALSQQTADADESANVKGVSAGTAKAGILSISTTIPSLGGSLAIQIPTIPEPTGEASHVDLSKQLALFRQDTQDTAYQSQRNRLQGEALINDLKNMAASDRIFNNVSAYSKVVEINTLFTLTAVESERAVENALNEGLQNQQAQLEELQKQLEGLGDFDDTLQNARQQVQEALVASNAANAAVVTAQVAENDAKAQLAQATKTLDDATATLDKAKQDAAANPADETLADAVKTAQQAVDVAIAAQASAQTTYDQAVSDHAFAKTEATKADTKLETAKSDLGKAQSVAQTGADLTAKIAAMRQSIEQGTYAIDVTEALPKINELVSSSASYIEQLAELNPQLSLKDMFLAELSVQPQSGVSLADSLTSELSSRLRATGMSATEADTTASLIVSGSNMEVLTLPKTAVDVIQQFSNDVRQATGNSLNALKNSFDLSAPKPTPETTKLRDNVKQLHRVMDALMPDAELTEEDAITAFLIAMGKAIDEMCELQDKLYEERIAIERELKNHAHI